MNNSTLSTCPACGGWGVLGTEGGYTTCTTCSGAGMWLTDANQVTFTYSFPSIVPPFAPNQAVLAKILRYSLTIGALSLTLACFALILQSADSLGEIVWKQGFAHIGFGLGGLLTMGSLALYERRRTSKIPLTQLKATSGSVTLNEYANERVSELLARASSQAIALGDDTITDATLLATLLAAPRIQSMIARLEQVPDDVLKAAQQYLARGSAGTPTATRIHPTVKERILTAYQRALALGFPYLDLEDILLVYAESEAWQTELFKQFDMTPKSVLAITKWYADDAERLRKWAFWRERGRVKPKGHMNRAWTALPTPFLDQVSRDLTSMAAQGALPSTLARNAEVQRSLEVLGNPTNRNLLLVGDNGVGKSTIIMALAFRMVEENVPEVLRDHRLVEIDLATLLTTGDAEQNVQRILQEVEAAGNVILAIPEVQSLVATTSGPLDAASILANALKQGQIQVISTATYADFHRYVEQNAQLTSLLTIVEVKPPTVEQAIAILEEEGVGIENREGVYLTYPALEAAVELAEQYISDQVLPQSALSLLGEAASVSKTAGKRWVEAKDVQSVIEKRTGVPVQAASAEEGARLLNLESELHKRIVGQEQAVTAVADALRRARAGLHTGNRPIATFLFVGPTGVGKTEMAKAVAALYFGREEAFLRLDMSEYQEGTSVYRLIGAPATNTDSFTEGGALTQPIREHPFSLLLLDEIEKAHPDVLNLFLQVLDDGRLTENTGRTVQFRNTIVVATSNAANVEINKLMTEGINPQNLPKQVLALLQQSFKPEFLNRFDAIIPFRPLTQDEAGSVTNLLLQPVIANAAEKGIALSFTPDAIAYLTKEGYDPQFGGRPLRRVIQDKVEALLAKLILSGSATKGTTLSVTADMLQ